MTWCIFLDYDVTNKTLSPDLSYIIDALIWPKFGNSSISIGEVIITSLLQGFDEKSRFFEGWSWFKFINLRLVLGTAFRFYIHVAKGLKLKVRKFCGLSHMIVEVTVGKTGKGPFVPCPLPPPPFILNMVKDLAVFLEKM